MYEIDFSLNIFGQEFDELTYSKIELFFNEERNETSFLEFKSFRASGNMSEKFRAIKEGICGFLNSEGGVLIWGAPEGNRVNGRKTFSGQLTSISADLDHDSIVNQVHDGIIPMPASIRVRILTNQNCDSRIVVFQTQVSPYSPHQVNHRYYVRIDGQTKPAPHHFIEALMNKVRFPNIECYIKATNQRILPRGDKLILLNLFIFNWSPFQNEENIYLRMLVTPGRIRLPSHGTRSGGEFRSENMKSVLTYGEPVSQDFEIVFTTAEYTAPDNFASLTIFIAGKESPLKLSEYKIDLNNDRLEEVVQPIKQNILFQKLNEDQGHSKKSILESLNFNVIPDNN